MHQHHRKNSRKKVPRILSSENESSDTDYPPKNPKKNRIALLISSDESDTATEMDNLNKQKSLKLSDSCPRVADSDSDNSSVESMDFVMYPSKSVLLQIERSKKDKKFENKHHEKNNLRGRNQKCSVKNITKSKIPQRQTKIKKTFNKSSSEFLKKDEISKEQKKVQSNKMALDKVKNENIAVLKKNKDEPVCKKKLKNSKQVISKVENSNPIMRGLNNTNEPDSKICKDYEPKEEFQNKVPIKVKNINHNLISCNIKSKKMPRSSGQHPPEKEIQKDKVIVTNIKNNNENFISHCKNTHRGEISNEHQSEKKIQKNEGIITKAKNENRNPIMQSVKSKNVSKSKIFNQHQAKKKLQNNKVMTTEVKEKNVLDQTNLASNKEKIASHKIPLLPSSRSDKNEKSLSNNCHENDKVTCCGFQKEKCGFQVKESTVKKRSENFGFPQKPLLSDLKSSVENESSPSKHNKRTKITNINQLKAEGNVVKKELSNNGMSHQIASDHLSSTNQQDYTVGNVEQSSTESQLCNSSEFIGNIDRRMHKSLSCPSYEQKLIHTIVNTDIRCIEEREKIKKLFRDLLGGLELLPLSFKSFDSYFHKYEPFFYSETYHKIFDLHKTNLTLPYKNFSFLVKNYKYVNDLILLNCESEVNEDRPIILAKNNLTIVKLKGKNDLCNRTFETFGFIHELESFWMNDIFFYDEEDFQYDKSNYTPPSHQFFTMFVKNQGMVALNCLMEGKVICNLYKEMKEIEGLHLMKSSLLLHEILNPRWETFFTPYNAELCMREFLEVCLHISDIVCYEIKSVQYKPKIMLLEGPPGSCKTMSIVSIAWRLSALKDKKKVLIVAPNLISVNEIAHKLEKYDCQYNSDHLKLCNLILFQNIPYYEEVLKDASIILTRPRDIYKLKTSRNFLQFSCCLVDDVNQFTELEILYPFTLDIQKFLLVGDPKQLPAQVRSNASLEFGYQKSIMERFQSFFSKTCNKNPTIVLKQQFRMHPDIALFPFMKFYPNHFHKSVYASNRSALHPFKHYVMFDYECSSPFTKELPHIEMKGVQFISSLLNLIFHKFEQSDVGIIVPSDEAKQAYQSLIKTFPSLSVGPVEFFQGQEKLIIIMSCFHNSKNNSLFHTDYFSDSGKLNVALTRAISSVIICGPINPLMKYDNWKAIFSYFVEKGYYCKITESEKYLLQSHLEKI